MTWNEPRAKLQIIKNLIKLNKFLCSLQSAFISRYFGEFINSLIEMLFRPRFKLNATQIWRDC